MIKISRQFALVAVATLALVAISPNIFSPSYALTSGGSITALGIPLAENFDGLSSAGAWIDNSTIPGWYSNLSAFSFGTGSSTTGAMYSFGVAGTNLVTDRALGSVASGTAPNSNIIHAARLINNTGGTIASLDIAYMGEQWRNGGNTTAQTLTFQYQVANAGVITDADTPNSGWITSAALSFTGPIATATAGLLDGNAVANRTAKSATLAVTVNAGQEMWVRWQDLNDVGNDHGLAIDDFSVTAKGAADTAPTVNSTTPANGALNVSVSSSIVINFSESVTASASAFTLQCPAGTPQTFTQSATPANSVTLTPTASLPPDTACTVSVVAAQISDTDVNDPPDQMAANYTFSFTTAVADSAPAVTSTSPVNSAVNVPVASNIIINFSESVTATVNAFAITCGSSFVFAQTVSPASSFTLNPDLTLPYSRLCTVTVTAAEVSDTDADDPPDHLAADYSFSFTTEARPVATNVFINEVDADTPGNPDTAEFVELNDGGVGNTPLDGLVVVFYNGGPNGDFVHQSYGAFDLDGYQTDSNGYFVLGNPGVSGAQITFDPGDFGFLQNGADAVALYAASASNFPNGTAVTTANLRDAIVYDTDDADDATLLALLNSGQPQVNENASGDGTNQSNARCASGTGGFRNTASYLPATPTPGAVNQCPASRPPSDLVISQIYGGGGNTGATYTNDYVELFNRGLAPVDIAGWSLQYAASTGSGWGFNKQPLGGIIGAGEYYLIGLAGGAVGGPFPVTPNITGAINMSGTNGKIALVNNGDTLAGGCPVFNPHLADLVGYGSADCGEGATKAPAMSNTLADYRKTLGSTDTDNNASDFQSGAPIPRRTTPIQELGPAVFNTDPSANSVTAPRDPTLVVSFTEPVTVDADWFDVSCAITGSHNSATVAGNGQFQDITLNTNLLAGEQCTVTIFADKVHDTDTNDSAPHTDTLFANYTWSFTVATGTAPPYPADVHLTMGNPSGAVNDIAQPNNYLMSKPEFALSYDRDLGRPNWVSWHLSDEWTGTLTRVDTFRADPQVPPEWYRVQGFDFSGSGFDRGHLTPNADRDKETSTPINQATFLMTNMMAQAPDNNQGPWANMEAYLRTLVDAGNEIYIVAGPAGVGGAGSGGSFNTIANGHVTVPNSTWKVALVLPKALGDDISRVTCATRTIAVIMPNTQGIRTDAWENYITTVAAVEALTGYDFFSNLPDQVQYCVETGTNGTNPPLDITPPEITCAAADGAWHSDNVDLGCTATDSGSGLAHAADAAFSLTTSVVAGTENASAATNSRVVCDRAGNCGTAGPIGGNQIDRVNPTVSITSPAEGATLEQGQSVAAAFACADSGSGIGSCMGNVASGAAFDTSTAGPHAFTVTGTDHAGNTAAMTVNYTVSDTVAPSVTCGATDGAWHGNNVVIACAAVDSGTGLANPSEASFTLTTSVAAGAEDANASTGTRAVFDLAGNWAPAGPIAGNKIDRKIPTIVLTSPANGAVYQLNRVVNAAFACADAGSGVGFCAGTSANGAAIDTSSIGAKSFVVNASDAAGNTAGAAVNYTVAAATISINNMPAPGYLGQTFVPTYAYGGDGTASVTSTTPDTCTVSGATVTFVTRGTCTLVAQAAATANFDAATGAPQSLTIVKRTPTIRINNIPGAAVKGGSFTPTFDYTGNGTTHVQTETPSTCKVVAGAVKFLGTGTCTLTTFGTPDNTYEKAIGLPQSFAIN